MSLRLNVFLKTIYSLFIYILLDILLFWLKKKFINNYYFYTCKVINFVEKMKILEKKIPLQGVSHRLRKMRKIYSI